MLDKITYLFLLYLQACSGSSRSRMDCRAPALPPGVYYTGVLMDAACHLLDINTIVVVQPDPYFEPFREVLTFSETDFLNDNIIITIQVHTCGYFNCELVGVLCQKEVYILWMDIAWDIVKGA